MFHSNSAATLETLVSGTLDSSYWHDMEYVPCCISSFGAWFWDREIGDTSKQPGLNILPLQCVSSLTVERSYVPKLPQIRSPSRWRCSVDRQWNPSLNISTFETKLDLAQGNLVFNINDQLKFNFRFPHSSLSSNLSHLKTPVIWSSVLV